MNPIIHASYLSPICFDYLIKVSEIFDSENFGGVSILSILLLRENYHMANYIIEKGANIDYVSSKGKTSLHVMVERKLEEQVKFLL
jgi:ankyrin repeat protein